MDLLLVMPLLLLLLPLLLLLLLLPLVLLPLVLQTRLWLRPIHHLPRGAAPLLLAENSTGVFQA